MQFKEKCREWGTEESNCIFTPSLPPTPNREKKVKKEHVDLLLTIMFLCYDLIIQ